MAVVVLMSDLSELYDLGHCIGSLRSGMPAQSRRLSEAGIKILKNAIKQNGWTQKALATQLTVSRSTISQLLAGQPVRGETIEELCHLLEIEIGQVLKQIASSADLEALVRRLREQTSAGINQRCGLMRILDMTTPIDSGAIYTAVNILERITSKTRRDLDELMDCGPEEFDRFMLGQVRERRVDGLAAVADKKQLMILGRPGAGKTTFLKRLAMLCRSGEFLSKQVPIFVTLKEWAESLGQPGLLEFVGRYFSESIDSVQQILAEGRGLLLLDGLDEVLEKDHDRVLTDIREFAQKYKDNHIIITCRIAAREYIFQQFTEVEVADFSDKQIQEFADKWFLVKEPKLVDEEGKSTVGKLFWTALEEREPVKELATNPLLLTLLCLEFENSAEFPKGRAELYERGLYLLLSKWDGQRRIQRESAYGKLSVKRKESLLGQLAISTFERGDYFFKEQVAERQIGDYIQNLPEAKTDSEALLVDSRDVLRDIVAQHGLLTERARGIYSFSHLTFHEYFAARSIVDISNPAKYELAVSRLMGHVADKRWREVFLLVVERSDDAGYLLTRIKQKIDGILPEDEKFKSFLTWVNQKVIDVKETEQPLVIQFFYYLIGRGHTSHRYLEFLDLNLNLDPVLKAELELDRELSHILSQALAKARALATSLACSLDIDLNREIDLRLELNGCLDLNSARATAILLGFHNENYRDGRFEYNLQLLQEKLPDIDGYFKQKLHWWSQHITAWSAQLQTVIIKDRNIGHDWKFNDSQRALLDQYYDANELLADCLKSECYADRKLLQHIEETMFLPITEIEKRKQP
jgi:predicted NACHT family NTPase